MTPLWGKYLGRVTDIDDPKKMRRVCVEVPEIAMNEALDWALPCDAYPTDWLPEVGDYVWIEFRGGMVDHPIWVGRAVAKNQVDADFVASYGSAYRKDHDANGNEIEWTPDQSSLGAAAILVNGTKRLATEDLLAWMKTNLLDFVKSNIVGWLKTHQHVGNMGAPTPLFPADLVTMTATEATLTAAIADYETKRAAGGDHLTDKTKAG